MAVQPCMEWIPIKKKKRKKNPAPFLEHKRHPQNTMFNSNKDLSEFESSKPWISDSSSKNDSLSAHKSDDVFHQTERQKEKLSP